MRKILVLPVAVLLALAVTASSAGAFTFEQGETEGKLKDWGSFFAPTYDQDGNLVSTEVQPVPSLGGYVPAVGDLLQTVIGLRELATPGYAPSYWGGSSPYLTGLVYDLAVGQVIIGTATGGGLDFTNVTIHYVSAGLYDGVYTGGRVDLWEDTTTLYNPAQDPAQWVNGSPGGAGWDAYPFDAGEYDQFPTFSDGTPVFSGTLVPYDPVNLPNVLLTMRLNLVEGSGYSEYAYIHVTHNYSNTPFDAAYLGGLAEISYYANYTYYPNSQAPAFLDTPGGEVTGFAAQSEDPIRFTPLPEPASLALLGLALAGMGVVRRRKRS